MSSNNINSTAINLNSTGNAIVDAAIYTSSLSDTQEIILSFVPLLTSLLSAIGSATIIYMIAITKRTTQQHNSSSNNNRNPSTPMSSYHRILFGLSCSDLLMSVVISLQPFLGHSDNPERFTLNSTRIWAIGNGATCSVLGFWQHISSMNVWYNGMLSVYFLLSVKFGIRQRDLSRHYEPYMHLISIGIPLVTASIGAGLGIYDEQSVGIGCYISNYPKGCVYKESERVALSLGGDGDDDSSLPPLCSDDAIMLLMVALPTAVIFLSTLINHLLVYCHVRNTIKRSMAYLSSYQQQNQNQSCAMEFSTASLAPTQRSSRRSQTDRYVERIRAVGTQAILYVSAFIVTLTPTVILKSMDLRPKDENRIFVLLVTRLCSHCKISSFIYIRPSNIRQSPRRIS